ncbi:hypothetical protein OG21DRAFT_1486899 [Imleria badia]|nr:hypothetical protein OG21DRAFT_1486899 [Imleria badia]
MAYQTSVHMYCPPDPATTRLEWNEEKTQHSIIQHEWKLAMERHAREVEECIHEENERQEKVRQEWASETERHVREFEEMQSCEREEWERERQRRRQEGEERDRREAEERQKLHIYWGHVEALPCTTYATREYTARLMNLPTTWENRVDACKATLLKIHRLSHLPTTCEDRGPGVVIGRWEINQREPDCTTFWDSYNDKVVPLPTMTCSGLCFTRLREEGKHITHKLMNLPEHGDWKEFCATTPAHFNNMRFPSPQECSTSGTQNYPTI